MVVLQKINTIRLQALRAIDSSTINILDDFSRRLAENINEQKVKRDNIIPEYAVQNPNSIYIAFLLFKNINWFETERVKKIYAQLSLKVKNSYYGLKLAERIQAGSLKKGDSIGNIKGN